MADERLNPIGRQLDDDDSDSEKLAKEELLRLQRQYRKMEAERQGYTIQSGSNVATQLKIVACFEREQIEIVTDLTNVMSERNQAQDRETIRIISEMLDQFAAYKEKIEFQLMQIAEMDEQVSKITKRVVQQKLKVQAIFGHSMTLPQARRHQSILENRLYRITTDFDSQVTRNRVVRQEITNYLTDRGQFHNKYRGVKRRIARMKRHMLDLVDVATSTYDQREEFVIKIKALRERNDKESRSHVLEMKEYHRLLHNDEKARAFMETKRKSRALLEGDDVRLKRKQNAKEKYFDDLLRSYRKSFREILAVSNCRDIKTLLQQYLAQETLNFTRFQYLSTLNSELDFIERAVAELKAVVEVKAAEHKKHRSEQLNGLKKAEAEFESTVEHLDERRDFVKKCSTNLDRMLESLEESFRLAKCDEQPIIRLLGNPENQIIPENVDLCMKLLERRVQELQSEDAVLEIRKAVEVDGVPISKLSKFQNQTSTIGRKPMGGFVAPKSVMRLELAGANDEEDEDRTFLSQRPLTFAEIKADILLKYRGHETASIVSSQQLVLTDLEPY